MKLIIHTIKQIQLIVNGEVVEPISSGDKILIYEFPVREGDENVMDIIHYETSRELSLFYKPFSYNALIHSLFEGFDHYYYNETISFIPENTSLLEYQVEEISAQTGLISYSSCKLAQVRNKKIRVTNTTGKYYPSRLSSKLFLMVPLIKWVIGFFILFWFDIEWGSEILHHSAEAEVYTNLLSPLHLYITIPILTIFTVILFVMDLHSLRRIQSLQRTE